MADDGPDDILRSRHCGFAFSFLNRGGDSGLVLPRCEVSRRKVQNEPVTREDLPSYRSFFWEER
jgi:hypothetical protein